MHFSVLILWQHSFFEVTNVLIGIENAIGSFRADHVLRVEVLQFSRESFYVIDQILDHIFDWYARVIL